MGQGRRTSEDANIFTAKLSIAVSADRFQLSTDGFDGYPAALEHHLGRQIDYAQLIKSYSGNGLDSERRYSPPSINSHGEARHLRHVPIDCQ
jgi:hypothetical protein